MAFEDRHLLLAQRMPAWKIKMEITYSDDEVEGLFEQAIREHLYYKYLFDGELRKTIGEIEREIYNIKKKLTTEQKRRILALKVKFQDINLFELIEKEEEMN